MTAALAQRSTFLGSAKLLDGRQYNFYIDRSVQLTPAQNTAIKTIITLATQVLYNKRDQKGNIIFDATKRDKFFVSQKEQALGQQDGPLIESMWNAINSILTKRAQHPEEDPSTCEMERNTLIEPPAQDSLDLAIDDNGKTAKEVQEKIESGDYNAKSSITDGDWDALSTRVETSQSHKGMCPLEDMPLTPCKDHKYTIGNYTVTQQLDPYNSSDGNFYWTKKTNPNSELLLQLDDDSDEALSVDRRPLLVEVPQYMPKKEPRMLHTQKIVVESQNGQHDICYIATPNTPKRLAKLGEQIALDRKDPNNVLIISPLSSGLFAQKSKKLIAQQSAVVLREYNASLQAHLNASASLLLDVDDNASSQTPNHPTFVSHQVTGGMSSEGYEKENSQALGWHELYERLNAYIEQTKQKLQPANTKKTLSDQENQKFRADVTMLQDLQNNLQNYYNLTVEEKIALEYLIAYNLGLSVVLYCDENTPKSSAIAASIMVATNLYVQNKEYRNFKAMLDALHFKRLFTKNYLELTGQTNISLLDKIRQPVLRRLAVEI